MKIIEEKSESGEDLTVHTSDDEDGMDEDYESNPLLQDILLYRMLYARQQARLPSHPIHKVMWYLLRNLGDALGLLAPAAFLAIICGKDSPVIKFFQQFDRALRNALFPPPNQSDEILKWLRQSLPDDERLTFLDAVWSDCSIICDLVNSVIPGACPGHGDEERDLSHGQRLIEQYLGVPPIFSVEDLSQKTLSTYQECRLSHYLCRIRDAINQMSPPVSRAGTPLLNIQAYTFDYVARGMGTIMAYKDRKAYFLIYPTAQQSLEPGEISVQIRGPGTCYGSTLIPAIYGQTHIIRNAFLKLGKKKSISNTPLPLTRGSSYLRNYDTDIQSKYFIPMMKNDIEVSIDIKKDKVKVYYTPTLVGAHEISLISKGCHVIGSPFKINVEMATKQENEDHSDEDACESPAKLNNRRIIFSVVDFVTEKMILTEEGHLEKISNTDAEFLLKSKHSVGELTNKYFQLRKKLSIPQCPDIIENKGSKAEKALMRFRKAVKKIITFNNVCREIKSGIKTDFVKATFNQATPDVVTSTILESKCYELPSNHREQVAKERNKKEGARKLRQKFKNTRLSTNATTENSSDDICDEDCVCNINIPAKNEISSKYPDDGTSFQDLPTPQKPRHKIHAEPFSCNTSIDIIISSFDNDDDIPIHWNSNDEFPVLEKIPERPKTPVLKILESVLEDNEEIDISAIENEKRKVEIDGDFSIDYYANFNENTLDQHAEQTFSVESVQHEDELIRPPSSIDFHIGEPVTPTRMFRSTSLEPDMDSIILASNLEEALVKFDQKLQEHSNSDDSDLSDFVTPMRQTPFEDMTDSQILRMYEDILPNNENSYSSPENHNKTESLHEFNIQKGGVNIRRPDKEEQMSQNSLLGDDRESNFSAFNSSIETWDSAYISIDDINSSPDSNYSPRNDFSPKQKLFPIEEIGNEVSVSPTNDRATPTENKSWKNRVESEIEKEREFNEAFNGTDTNFYPKSLRLYQQNISIIDENDYNLNSLPTFHFNENDTITQIQLSKSDTDISRHNQNKYDFSASDNIADVNKSACHPNISTIQMDISELNRENLTYHSNKLEQCMINKKNFEQEQKKVDLESDENKENQPKTKKPAKMVSEKKDYWDNKIKILQSREEKKNSSISRKRNPLIKRNDSLSRKKGKPTAKSQNVTEIWKNTFAPNKPLESGSTNNQSLVARWKDYWNEKVENVNKTIDYEIRRQKTKFKSVQNLNADEEKSYNHLSNNTKSDSNINFTSKFLNLPRNDKIYSASQNNIFKYKYQPRAIDLKSVTKRVEKIREVFPSPSPDIDIDEAWISKADVTNKGIENIYKSFDSINKKINANITCDNIGMDGFKYVLKNNSQKSEVLLGGVETSNINRKETNRIYELENLSSFPIVSKIKAEMENTAEKSCQKTKQTFLNHKSKSFDAPQPFFTKSLKKCYSLPKIDENISIAEALNEPELIKVPSIAELKKTFECKSSRENINLNASTESIPSLKNRRLKLEQHLKQMQQKIATQKEEQTKVKTPKKTIDNENEARSKYDTVNEATCTEEAEIFKPIGEILKVFEEKFGSEDTKGKNRPKTKAYEMKESSERILEPVAEKGEGTRKYEQDSSTMVNHLENLSTSQCTKDLSLVNIDVKYDEQENAAKRDLDEVQYDHDYKDRFMQAKTFFQQLDKIIIIKTEKTKPISQKLSDCQLLLLSAANDTNETKKGGIIETFKKQSVPPAKPIRKCPIKSMTFTLSDTEYEMRRRTWSPSSEDSPPPRLRKISEKFMVEDLFRDVIGDSSIIGYNFKGIPHKKAVLAAFRSMECVNQRSSYELTMTQMEDFAKKNGIVNAQTYHTDFPYLPTTEPNKYRSRYDAVASGLINRKDLLKTQKMRRRYSEPARPRMLLDFMSDV